MSPSCCTCRSRPCSNTRGAGCCPDISSAGAGSSCATRSRRRCEAGRGQVGGVSARLAHALVEVRLRPLPAVLADGGHQTVRGSYALAMAKSVADLLSEREGTRLDFKQDLSSMKRVLETVCSFLNTAGGTLVVGVEDQTRVVLGLDDVEKQEEKLANSVASAIEPQPTVQLEIVTHEAATFSSCAPPMPRDPSSSRTRARTEARSSGSAATLSPRVQRRSPSLNGRGEWVPGTRSRCRN